MRVEVHVTREIIDAHFATRTRNHTCPVAVAAKPLLEREWGVGGDGELYRLVDLRFVEYRVIEGQEGFDFMLSVCKAEDVPPFVLVYEIPEEELCLTN